MFQFAQDIVSGLQGNSGRWNLSRILSCPGLRYHRCGPKMGTLNDHLSQSSIRLVEALESFSCPVQDMFFGLLDSDDSDSISMQACRVLVCILGGRVFGRQSVGVGPA